ncbi:uncharacterized protein LOC9630990 [Selaginella moellendorffii]|uniref:uncharacterized protein LOC9630990 n=1 Tax=Selaginella moellendorffii TaxID=88036 RepID=UPI000D1CF5C9|nr:uncharacterized protein LOC9630990 [Selaginella moellendorffii]|eukprot:XP_024519907.1 uncharacterized protein LOC9630990 [Selaginella moellendorffii]
MLSRLWERKSKVLKAKGSSDEPPKELEARPVENTDPPPKELEAKNTDPPPKQLEVKNTNPPPKEWEDRLVKSTDLTVSLDSFPYYLEVGDLSRDSGHGCGQGSQCFKNKADDDDGQENDEIDEAFVKSKVLERCTRLVVYFPDPEDWFRRAVAITQRKEFLEKLQDKLDMLSGGIVLIASRINVQNKCTRSPGHTGYYLEDIYSLFENKVKIVPPKIAYDEYEKMLLPCVIAAGETGVSFRNVGGLKKVKATLQELVILPLTRPKLFSKGNLLKWYGEAEKLAKAVFTLAEKLAPTIIFVDEVDSILGARGELNEDVTSRSVKNEFMTAWDGLRTKDDKRVMVLAATNRPFDLDEAVIRRLPRRILISLPKGSSRVEILKVLLEGEKLDKKFDLEELGRLTTGYSGSDLKNLCTAAAYVPVRELLAKEAEVCRTARFVNTQLEAWNQQYGEVKEKDMEIVNGVYQKQNWFGIAVKTPEISKNVKEELCKICGFITFIAFRTSEKDNRQQGRRGHSATTAATIATRAWKAARVGTAQMGFRREAQASAAAAQLVVAAPPSNGTKQ